MTNRFSDTLSFRARRGIFTIYKFLSQTFTALQSLRLTDPLCERRRERFSTRDRISNPHAFKNPMVLLGQCGIVENFVYFDRAVEKIHPSHRPILNSNCNFCLLTHELFSYTKNRGFRCGKLCGKLWKPCGKLCGKVGVGDFSTGFSTEFSTIPQRGQRHSTACRYACRVRSAVVCHENRFACWRAFSRRRVRKSS